MIKTFGVWRFVIGVGISKSFLWGKGNDTYFFHIGSFSDGDKTAIKFVFLFLTINIGFISWHLKNQKS